MKQILLGIATVLHLMTHTNTPSAQYVKLLPHVMNAQVSLVQTELKKGVLAQDEIGQLIDVAQNEKKRVQLEIDALGGKKIRWGLLGKGFLHMLGTSYCLYNTGIVVYSGVRTARRDIDGDTPDFIGTTPHPEMPEYIDRLLANNSKLSLLIALCIHPLLTPYNDLYATFFEHKNYFNFFAPTSLTLIGLWATYEMACASGHNLKQGWNYQAVLEKKIAQFDEIITYLETHAIQSK